MAKQMKSFRLSEEAIAVIEHRNRERYRSGQAYVESLLLGGKETANGGTNVGSFRGNQKGTEPAESPAGKAAETSGIWSGTEEKNRREQTAIYPAAF